MNISHDKNKAVDNALTVFWEKGYACTSLKDLERVTGMYPGSIYSAFGSKAKLYCQAMDRYVEWVNRERTSLSDEGRNSLERLADFVEFAHPVANAKAPVPACFLVKTTLETGVEQQAIKAKLSALMDENDRLLTSIFQSAIDQGELPPSCDAAELAAQLSADLAGLCFYALRTNDEARTQKMVAGLATRLRQADYASAVCSKI